MKDIRNSYEKTNLDAKIFGETPHGLVRLLLEKLCQKLTDAHRLMEITAPEDKVKNAIQIATTLGVATDIVQALSDSLIEKEDSELYHQLSFLYAHVQYQILMANVTQKTAPVTQALRIATSLLETWCQVPTEFHHMTSRS